MSKEILNYEQPIKFITGFAGSGKSTRLAKECNENTLVLTPTHKAAGVLIRKGVKNVFTIHSVLKLVPTINDNFRGKQSMQKLKRVGNVDLSEINRIAIDEFSMIPTFIFDLLTELLPAKTEILVFGDPYQNKPISGELIDPYFCTENVEELTTQYRSNAPEVVETFMRFMEYIKAGSVGNADLTMHKDISKYKTPKEAFEAECYDPGKDTIIAYTNNQVINLNNTVVNYLGLPPEIRNGDDLVINNINCSMTSLEFVTNQKIFPNCISKGMLMQGDDLDKKVSETLENIDKYNTDISEYKQATIMIDGYNYYISYDENHYATAKRLKNEVTKYQNLVVTENNLDDDVKIPKWCSQNRQAPYVRERGKAWSAYLAHQGLVFDMRRPYASTVHKAQGQEFRTVYIAHNDMKLAIRDNYYDSYCRLMYVALSRAMEKVIII